MNNTAAIEARQDAAGDCKNPQQGHQEPRQRAASTDPVSDAVVRAWIAQEQPNASAADLYAASQRLAAGGDLETARAVFRLADERAAAHRAAHPDAPAIKRPPPPQRRKGGRPPIDPSQRTTTRALRLNDARWAKLKALGTDWLAKQIDRAPDPRSA